MRADAASHLLRHALFFELFLFSYLFCALLLQKVNIYKTVCGGHYIEYWAVWAAPEGRVLEQL